MASSSQLAVPKDDIETGVVGADESGETNESDQDKGFFRGRSTMTVIWLVVALCGGGLNFLLPFARESVFVLACAICAIILSGSIIHFQLELDDEDSFREVQNQLREQANRLTLQNDVLTGHVDHLEGEVAKLQEAKDHLEVITKAQGKNVDTFVGLVRENGELLEKIKIAVRGRRTQLIAEAILTSDFDSSGYFAGTEIHLLQNNLLNVRGLVVNSSILKKRVEKNGDLSYVLQLVEEMKDSTIPDDQKVFYFDEKHSVDD